MSTPSDLDSKFLKSRWLERILRLFFHYLYHQFAWSYNTVAALVSGGRWQSWVLTALPYLETGTRILELGHGPGKLLLTAREKGIPIVGLDPSRQMGRIAFQRLDGSGFSPLIIRGYAQFLPLPAAYFDRVVATFPTDYILDPSTLAEVNRILIGGGSLVIVAAAWIEGSSVWDRILAWLFRFTGQAPESQDAQAGLAFSDRLTQAGFSVQPHRVALRSSSVLVLEAVKPEYNYRMEVQIAVSKVNKYATSESGDTLEVVERPGGGLSIVLADGQQSGRSAKKISNLVVRKVISLLAEGVRDGAAARAASDALFHEKGGKVQATLNILSVDLMTKTLVITRNNPAPILYLQNGVLGSIGEEWNPVGLYRHTRPSIREIDLTLGLAVLAFTDGLSQAGDRLGKRLDLTAVFQEFISNPGADAQDVADALLDQALLLEQSRPGDDISLVVLRVEAGGIDHIRRLSLRLPLP